VAQATCDLELLDRCFFGCRGTCHFAVAAASFARVSGVTFSLRRHTQCLVRWCLAGIARDGPLRARFRLLLLPPIYSLYAKPEEIPRLIAFLLSSVFVGALSIAQRSATESLRRARDDLNETVQELLSANRALEAESRERKRAEENLRQAQADLAHTE